MLGVNERTDLKLFRRELIFEEFQPMWSWYLIVTDRRTDRRLTVASPCSALASRGKNRSVKDETVWFNDECKAAIRNRRKALKTVQKQLPTSSNVENYRIIRAKTRRTIKTTKRKFGKHMFPRLTTELPSRKFGPWYIKFLENNLVTRYTLYMLTITMFLVYLA